MALYKTASEGSVELTPLSVHRFVHDIARLFRHVSKRRISLRTVAPGRDLHVMADPVQMGKAFAGLARYESDIIGNKEITIEAKLLPIEADIAGMRKGCGCALLSIVAGVASTSGLSKRAARDGMRGALAAIRVIIKKHNGCLRIFRNQSRTTFNIYLPLVGRIEGG